MNFDVVALSRCRSRVGRFARTLHHTVVEVPRETGLRIMTVVIIDRPKSPLVRKVAETYAGRDDVMIVEPRLNISGHAWGPNGGMALLNKGLEAFDGAGHTAKWIWYHDDDQLLGPGYETTLADMLNAGDDMLAFIGVSQYLWCKKDGYMMVNVRPHHASSTFSRYKKGHRYPEDGRSFQNTAQLQPYITRRPDRTAILPFYILDIGLVFAEEREDFLRAQIWAGKVDNYIQKLAAPAQLAKLADILLTFRKPMDYLEWWLKKESESG